jgi:hypothetical protein
MSDDNFIARWSRLKRQTAKPKQEKGDEPAAPEPEGTPDSIEAAREKQDTERETAAEPEFDLSSLPPIEEIAAGTDIRAFLQSGVPAELTKAALRRAWTTDPAIRDFIGLAENQWDFTNPSSIPGFGPLGPADDVRQLVAGAMGRLDELAAAAEPSASGALQQADATVSGVSSDPEVPAQDAGTQEENRDRLSSHEQVEKPEASGCAAPQHVDAPADQEMVRKSRSHGSALPK